MKAKISNLKASTWAVYTFLAMIGAWIIGAMLMTFIFVMRDPKLRGMLTSEKQDQEEVMNYLKTQNMLLPEILITFCSIGGYLYVRHLMNKKIIVNNQNNTNEVI